jgi:hypothetical protein
VVRPKDLLLASDVKTVLENISSAKAKDEDKKKITTYYENNKDCMKYKQYRHIGCGIIGSGATVTEHSRSIESAHRTVVQKRMKLSGQRRLVSIAEPWSFNGATNMLRLRVISMNKQWAKVIDFLKTPP